MAQEQKKLNAMRLLENQGIADELHGSIQK